MILTSEQLDTISDTFHHGSPVAVTAVTQPLGGVEALGWTEPNGESPAKITVSPGGEITSREDGWPRT